MIQLESPMFDAVLKTSFQGLTDPAHEQLWWAFVTPPECALEDLITKEMEGG